MTTFVTGRLNTLAKLNFILRFSKTTKKKFSRNKKFPNNNRYL